MTTKSNLSISDQHFFQMCTDRHTCGQSENSSGFTQCSCRAGNTPTCNAMVFKQLAIQLVRIVAILLQPKKNIIRRPVGHLTYT